jgi:hypothetical protein
MFHSLVICAAGFSIGRRAEQVEATAAVVIVILSTSAWDH